jgi:hypothetical protein
MPNPNGLRNRKKIYLQYVVSILLKAVDMFTDLSSHMNKPLLMLLLPTGKLL